MVSTQVWTDKEFASANQYSSASGVPWVDGAPPLKFLVSRSINRTVLGVVPSELMPGEVVPFEVTGFQ